MFVEREGITTVILNNKNSFTIYKKSDLKSNRQELTDEGITYDIKEGVKNSTNKNYDAFVRNEKDGNTKYYKLYNVDYNEGEDYLLTPEDREFRKIRGFVKPQNNIRHNRKYKSNNKDRFEADISGKEINSIMFIFLIIVIAVTVISYNKQKNKPSAGEFVPSNEDIAKAELRTAVNGTSDKTVHH